MGPTARSGEPPRTSPGGAMKLFECQACGQPLYFENTWCESCRRRLGYLPLHNEVSALEPDGDVWRPLAAPRQSVRFCANTEHQACNWLLPVEEPARYCLACRHNRIIPDLSSKQNLSR